MNRATEIYRLYIYITLSICQQFERKDNINHFIKGYQSHVTAILMIPIPNRSPTHPEC